MHDLGSVAGAGSVPALEVVRIRVAFEDAAGRRGEPATVALDEVSLTVARGEIVALLGPSGCGKSTLLRVIAGLEPDAEGTVRWDGEDLVGVPTHRRGFGLVFQDGQLFAHQSVAENIAYGLRAQGMPREDQTARVAELLELVGLAGAGSRSVTTLSGGERQRIALARSLAPHPRLLMLDEPFSALDRELRDRLARETREILRETGTTAIIVTHDHAEAAAVADRIVRMRDGRVEAGPDPTGMSVATAGRSGAVADVIDAAAAAAAAVDDVAHDAADDVADAAADDVAHDAADDATSGPRDSATTREPDRP